METQIFRIILGLQSPISQVTSIPRSCLLTECSSEEHGGSRAIFLRQESPYQKCDPIRAETMKQEYSMSLGGQGDIWNVCLNWHTPQLCPPQVSSCEWIFWSWGKRVAGLAFDNGQVRMFLFRLNTYLPSSGNRAGCATQLTHRGICGSAEIANSPQVLETNLQVPPEDARGEQKGMLRSPAHPPHHSPNPTTGNSRLWFSFLWLGGDRVSWSWASSPSSLARWVWA